TGNSVAFAAGQREAFVEIAPLPDALPNEPSETVVLSLNAGSGYTLGTILSGSVIIENDPATGSLPSAKEAARFLIQAAWGPDQDSPADTDQIPENVEEVMISGFDSWINNQYSKPIGLHQPLTEWFEAHGNAMQIYGDYKQFAWWSRVLDYPKLSPTDPTDTPSDPLRQRIAFCLSQLLVVSDRTEDLANERIGLANYYDLLLTHAFGNYRDLLLGVSLHPCMGMYLSHLGNKKPDPANRIYPDENYAREVMQLFTIGLWELNADGTRRLDAQGQPIPTYTNATITEMARVFTGLSFGQPGNNNFTLYPRDYTWPMKGWDAQHDLAPKTLLNGVTTPARTASPGNTGTATMADVTAAVESLFNHPHCGPFVCHKLIQRLVTSNPSPAYLGRVSAAFADNGAGVRGDMKSVIKAILLDPEARGFDKQNDPTFGKMREPLMRVVNFARAFNAASQVGWYQLDAFALDHLQEPQRSPSVFNYYLPTYTPPGALASAGLAAPEFQLVNASSAHLSANYFYDSVFGGLHRWGVAEPTRNVKLNLTQEMQMNIPSAFIGQDMPNTPPLDPDPLIRRLDLALTGGTLTPLTLQLIRENTHRTTSGWQWPQERLRTAIYLIMNSPDFAVQR
ncbi:MAG: hypothetical protein JWL81_2044, partial [Verrucomicrobiales bacterium]|nr:hypothetical protein [Verrucomicrobiales bacterium]